MKQMLVMLSVVLAGEVTLVPTLAQERMPEQSVLRLRSQVVAPGTSVTLAELVDLSAAAPELQTQLGSVVMLEALNAEQTTTFTLDDLIQRLDRAGVNRAAVLITGALRCEVTFTPQPLTDKPETRASSTREPLFRVDAPQMTSAASSLAEHVRAHFAREFADDGGDVEVQFDRASSAFLDLTSPPYEFSLRSRGRGNLGAREVRVTIRRDGHTQRTVDLYAQVRLVKHVAVAKRALNVGAVVGPDDLKLERHIFDSHTDVGLDDVNVLVGQQVKQFVPAGTQIGRASLKSVDLVKRSRPVTLVGSTAGVHATVTGVALDSGEYGEEVRVRLGDRRNGKRVLRGVVTGVGTVRLINS